MRLYGRFEIVSATINLILSSSKKFMRCNQNIGRLMLQHCSQSDSFAGKLDNATYLQAIKTVNYCYSDLYGCCVAQAIKSNNQILNNEITTEII